jgi:hypothetical protein
MVGTSLAIEGNMVNIKQFRKILGSNPDQAIHIMLPDGRFVPDHFHITEVGHVHKKFIDCGGNHRDTTHCALQVWTANDTEHRLDTAKLAKIMDYAKCCVGDELDLMVEYGVETVSQYPVANIEVTPMGILMVLGNKPTACLAPDKCGIKGCC